MNLKMNVESSTFCSAEVPVKLIHQNVLFVK